MNKLNEMELDIFEYLERGESQFFFLANPEKGLCRWSSNAKNILAIEDDRLMSFEWKELIHPADLESFQNSCQDIQRRHTKQFSEDYRFRLKTGEYAWMQCSCSMAKTAAGDKVYLSGIINKLNIENSFDPVTNLRYISSFRKAIDEKAKKKNGFGFLLIGIDDFKRINNLYSYSFGDIILSEFAVRLNEHLSEGAELFRLDGDNFGIIYPQSEITVLIHLFEKMQRVVAQPIHHVNVSVSLSISGSIARYPYDGEDADTIYKNARIAYIESKRRGKKQITVCSEPLCQQEQRRMKLLEGLRESIHNGCSGFSLKFQPLIHTETEELYGCEALMRWVHPEFPEGVSPYEFIPILENSGLIFEVNKWLIKEAFSQCKEWVDVMPEFHMNVNISYTQFEDPEFKFWVMRMLACINLPASAITLELTESHEVSDMNLINEVFSFLRSQGVRIALDDFGVGYSSLSIFQMLKVDQLKIDRSFLQRLTYDVTDQAIVRQITELCHSMNMMVCVEGVESDQITKIVREFGPELLQGFYFGCPMDKEDFGEKYFAHGQRCSGNSEQKETFQEHHSMVYSTFRPTQPLPTELIVNNAHAGVFQVAMNAEFSFITCNEGYRKMLGYTAKDIEMKFGNNALGIVCQEDTQYVNEEIRRQLGEGDTVTIEFRVVRSDGTPIWILGTGNVVKGPDGSKSLVVILIDNNKFKKQQIDIQKKCSRYEQILSNVPVGVKCVQNNEDFTLDYMSPAFLNLLGYEDKDLDTFFERKYINMVLDEDRPLVVSDVLEQVKSSNIVTLRYRSPCKDGKQIWVETISRLCPPEEDGIQRWYSSVVNITDTITEEQKKLTKNFANRIQHASEQWGDILFEYDFMTGNVAFSDNYKVLFGREPQVEMLAETASIYPADRDLLEEAIRMLHKGIKPTPIEVRYYSDEKGYFWVSIIFTEPSVLGGNPVSVIGRISDIDELKLEKENLVMQSRIDGLTGVLNKKSVETDIRRVMSENKNSGRDYALCVLDIDDFKGINDNFGHMFGDQVLRVIASRLRNSMGETAIVGRAGGDEFMVLALLGSIYKDADELGNLIVKTLKQPIKYEGKEVYITSSVGIALFPQDSTDFHKLFGLADGALYFVKAKGKSGYYMAAPVSPQGVNQR